MRFDAVWFEAEVFEQVVANQVRHFAELVAEAEIDIRFAEVDRQQLGMAVGDVQQADIAELGQVIEFCRAFFSQRNVTVQTHAASGCNGHDLKEFPTTHAHFIYP